MSTKNTINKGPLLGIRHLQALLIFLAIVVQLIARLNVSVAVVAMTNADSTNPEFEEYDWTNKEISYILSSFYWGYVLTQFPGGYFCRQYGVKFSLLISTFGSGVSSIIIPFCMSFGEWKILCAFRVMQGLFQGFLFPCVHSHLAKWAPVEERNRLGAMSQTGLECGILLGLFMSGKIASSSLGWPGIYYVSGGIALTWCLLWFIFASNTPSESRWITNTEKVYIETSLSKQQLEKDKRIPVPWRAILTSLPFWALLVVYAAESWGSSTLQTQIPSYMNGVLRMNIDSNTLYSSLPFLASWVLGLSFWIVSEIVLARDLLSLTSLRRIFNSIAFWIPASGLIAIGFLGVEQKALAIVLMTLVVGLNSGATIGSVLNTLDLSPNHAGILMGIVNTTGNLIPIITPLLVGLIVVDEHERSQWQIVFLVAAVVFFLGNLFYITCGTSELQPWNDKNFLQNNSKTSRNRKDHISRKF